MSKIFRGQDGNVQFPVLGLDRKLECFPLLDRAIVCAALADTLYGLKASVTSYGAGRRAAHVGRVAYYYVFDSEHRVHFRLIGFVCHAVLYAGVRRACISSGAR